MAPPVIFIFGPSYFERAFGHMMATAGWSVRRLASMRGICLTVLTATISSGPQWRRHATALLGITLPSPHPLEGGHLPPMPKNFYRARCHIGSRVIKPELGIDFLCPSYKAGLAATLEVEKPTD